MDSLKVTYRLPGSYNTEQQIDFKDIYIESGSARVNLLKFFYDIEIRIANLEETVDLVASILEIG